jgi:16S rRNA C967 or C1407 C5-methylase (RsmB/RsmF family)
MPEYIVEMRGECREVYVVEADSEIEARENWMNGSLQVQEASSMEVYDVREDE